MRLWSFREAFVTEVNDGTPNIVKQVRFPLWIWLLLVSWLSGPPWGHASQSLELMRRPVNAALQPPAGEGLHWLHGAESLGRGSFRLRTINRSQQVSLPGLGRGNAYTGIFALAYGLPAGLESSLVLPVLLDAVGGLNHYGIGDPVLGIKLSRPSRIPARFYAAGQLLVGLPLGDKKGHRLDDYGGVRAFSSDALDLGIQMLIDRHFRHLSMYLNGGYFRSGNRLIPPEAAYGIGFELGRSNQWLKINAEYWNRVSVAEEPRVAGVAKLGVRFSPFPGIEGELGREYGFFDHPSKRLFTFGVRLHGRLFDNRGLTSRHLLYIPSPAPKQFYQPDRLVRLAVVDFAGFEDYKAGQKLVEKITTRLNQFDSLEVVDLKRYTNIPHQGFLHPREAIELARNLGVDAVITGEVAAYEVDRFAGLLIPFLLKLPEARIRIELGYRVLTLSPDQSEMVMFVDRVAGLSRLPGNVQLLPADERNITSHASARALEKAQDRAFNDLVTHFLAAMATQFIWVPPDFLP